MVLSLSENQTGPWRDPPRLKQDGGNSARQQEIEDE
jgi:hypothetical protein